MYNKKKQTNTTIKVDNSYIGETIEEKINRIVNNNEPITDGAPLVYTNRKDGVLPDYDIRTDRFEVANDAMDIVSKQHIAKREERAKLIKNDEKPKDETNNNEGTSDNNATDKS